MKRMSYETLLNDQLVDWAVAYKTDSIYQGDAWADYTDKKLGGNLECMVYHAYDPKTDKYVFFIRYRTSKEKMESICEKHNMHVDQIVKGTYFLASN